MDPKLEIVRAVVLCGGQSSRMGSPKHLLQLPKQKSVLEHLLETIAHALPSVRELCVSLHDEDSALTELSMASHKVQLLYDRAVEHNGPAAGLLAAHERDSSAHWLVVACDYPLLTAQELVRLLDCYHDPVTCFQNTDGWLEPLIAIWSPQALALLKTNVEQGIASPSHAIKLLNGTALVPIRNDVLFNTNTPEQWTSAMELFSNDESPT